MIAFQHKPVLWRETVELLRLEPGMRVADCTAGGGGHSRMILERILPSGFLIAIDQDMQAVKAAEENLAAATAAAAGADAGSAAGAGSAEEAVTAATAATAAGIAGKPYVTVHSNFSRIKEILREQGMKGLDGALMDLGVSSFQLDEGQRGFSYQHAGPLDMRMSPEAGGQTAADLVNRASAQELEHILWRYGEERWSRRIAQFIVAEREKAPIATTDRLVTVIKKAVPAGAREEGPHPAKRSFQALRIFINRELEILERAITDTAECLEPGGRLAVITFHSLEDRLVKDTFKKLAAGCTCPKSLPVCVCGGKPTGRILTSKPVLPQKGEIEENPRARSAKLRGFQKYQDSKY